MCAAAVLNVEQRLTVLPLSSVEVIKLYMEIFDKLLGESIRYPRTKDLPLICCASLIKVNRFKDFSVAFLAHFAPGTFMYHIL